MVIVTVHDAPGMYCTGGLLDLCHCSCFSGDIAPSSQLAFLCFLVSSMDFFVMSHAARFVE